MKIIKKKLDEKIYGNLATVYHRTNYSNLINSVFTEGFKPGKGDMYGKGFYSTYELKSQNGSNMKDTYGSIVVKFIVPTENFFFFDYEEFEKIRLSKELNANKDNFLEKQMEYYNIDFENVFLSKYKNKSYSSDLAEFMTKTTNILRKVKGIVFTGRRDGKVLLSYDTKIIIPVSYRVDGEKEFTKVERNRDYFKKVLKRKLEPFTPDNTTYPDWFEKAIKFDFKATYKEKEDVLVWENGTWVNGTWETGNWRNGTWELGNWETGIWWKGLWEKGIWDDGTWIEGIWEDGYWENGTWRNGIWKEGNWKNGTWINGTWETGFWKNGTWLDGTWKNGTWLKGDWRNGTWVNGTWESGTWVNGTWESGTWVKGTWKKGWILDNKKQGNFEEDWEWRKVSGQNYVYSSISPEEYWKGIRR